MTAPVPTASGKAASSAPEFAGILRQRLEALAHKAVALEASVDASLLGKFLAGNAAMKIEDVSALVRIAGLKAVDQGRTCVPRAEIEFLRKAYRRLCDLAPWVLDEDAE